MQQIDPLQAYNYLFEMQVNDEHTKEIWVHNAGGAIATALVGQLPNSEQLIEKIEMQADRYGMRDQLDKYIERIKYLLNIQKGITPFNSEFNLQNFFNIADGK